MSCGECNNKKRDKNPFEWQNQCQKKLPKEFVKGLKTEFPEIYQKYYIPFLNKKGEKIKYSKN